MFNGTLFIVILWFIRCHVSRSFNVPNICIPLLPIFSIEQFQLSILNFYLNYFMYVGPILCICRLRVVSTSIARMLTADLTDMGKADSVAFDTHKSLPSTRCLCDTALPSSSLLLNASSAIFFKEEGCLAYSLLPCLSVSS